MVLRITEVYEMLAVSEEMAHALWVMETSLLIAAIHKTYS